jgi:chlorobactene lauroyltransferase
MRNNSEFIPADESPWFISLFDIYVRNLFWRKFHRIWVVQNYYPDTKSKTIYYLNHTSWWDGLIPLLLNRKLFRQNARAMMEDKQMHEHGFFKKIGAFSVNLENPRGVISSLRYAAESMNRENASLFIYPEGKIVPYSVKKPDFKKGLAWIVSKCPDSDVVPVGILIHTARSHKPEMFIRIGEPVNNIQYTELTELNDLLETELSHVLRALQDIAYNHTSTLNRLI